MAEGTVTRWLRAVGESVSAGEPLLEVSSDKVDVEVPAPASGVVEQVLVPEDATVEVGTVLAVIGERAALGPTLPGDTLPGSRVPDATRSARSALAAEPAARSPRHRHSPRVRRLARQNGIDADGLVGTGPRARVTPGDILLAREQAARSEAPSSTVRGAAESLRVPVHTQVIEVDLSLVLAQCAGRANSAGPPVSGTAPSTLFVAKAVLESLQAHSLLSRGSVDGGRVARHTTEDLGIAFDTPHGLMVPVLRDASALSLAGLHRRLDEMAERTLRGEIQAPELTGSYFTLFDSASRSILWDVPALSDVQSAALSVGAPVERPVVVHGEGAEPMIAIRSMAYMALTYHHQLIQRADAAEFLMTVKAKLEKCKFR